MNSFGIIPALFAHNTDMGDETRRTEDILQDLFRSTGKIGYYLLWKKLKGR